MNGQLEHFGTPCVLPGENELNRNRTQDHCLICDAEVDHNFKLEVEVCDQCGSEGCQHDLQLVDDEDFDLQRLLCAECRTERNQLGKVY